jgi:uncharacterized protein
MKRSNSYIFADLVVKRSSHGLGLFTNQDIKKGQSIVKYIGEKITEEEANRRGGRYLFQVNSRWTIDGSSRKNIARYINHSCIPNCEVEYKQGFLVVLAKRNIKAGEELSYDYGKEYFNDYIKPVGCRCLKCQSV